MYLYIFFFLTVLTLAQCSWPTSRGNYQRNGIGLFSPRDAPTKTIWEIQTGNTPNGDDTWSAGLVFGSNTGILYAVFTQRSSTSKLQALNITTGEVMWHSPLSGNAYDGSSSGSVLPDGSIIISHFSGADRFASNGSLLWTFKGDDFVGFPTLSITHQIAILTQPLGGAYIGLNINTGKQIWNAPTNYGFSSVPVLSLDESTFYVTVTQTTAQSGWISYSTLTGKLVAKGTFPSIGNPDIDNLANVVSNDTGEVYLFYSMALGDVNSCWPYCMMQSDQYQIDTQGKVDRREIFGNQSNPVAFPPAVSLWNENMYFFFENGSLFIFETSGNFIGEGLCECNKVCMKGVNFYSSSTMITLQPVIDTAGNAYVGIGNQYCSFTPTGKQRWSYTLPNNNFFISESAWDETGTIYVSAFDTTHKSSIFAL